MTLNLRVTNRLSPRGHLKKKMVILSSDNVGSGKNFELNHLSEKIKLAIKKKSISLTILANPVPLKKNQLHKNLSNILKLTAKFDIEIVIQTCKLHLSTKSLIYFSSLKYINPFENILIYCNLPDIS